jgi:hypothetical protein
MASNSIKGAVEGLAVMQDSSMVTRRLGHSMAEMPRRSQAVRHFIEEHELIMQWRKQMSPLPINQLA